VKSRKARHCQASIFFAQFGCLIFKLQGKAIFSFAYKTWMNFAPEIFWHFFFLEHIIKILDKGIKIAL
jgi:hypothetical protein